MLHDSKQQRDYLGELRSVVEHSSYESRYIYETLGMNEISFYRKLNTASFSPREVETLTGMLYPEEALVMDIMESEREIAEGKTISYEAVREKLRKKLL